MKLADVAQGRDNNFNLMRMCAAFAVLVSHSYALVTGRADSEPFRVGLGISLGEMAVDVFFITSGFLVAGSLLNRRSTLDFLWARFLRIYPALIVMVLLSVFVLGPIFTTLPWRDYLTAKETIVYLVKNSILLGGVAYQLPGVFETPLDKAVNGSLWTMPFEIKMYLILAFLWFGLRLSGERRLRLLEYAIVVLAVGAAAVRFGVQPGAHSLGELPRLLFMFFCGAAYYILRDRVALSWRAFLACVGILALSSFDRSFFYPAYNAVIAYVVLFLAYVPAGMIRRYNVLGDYSYGMYIYAYPVQRTVGTLVPDVTPMQMLVLASCATLALAILSWYLLERHALRLKSRYVDFSRRVLRYVGQNLLRRRRNAA